MTFTAGRFGGWQPSLTVILTPAEIERLLNTARKLRYYTILLTLYSMGLRLAEGLNLTIADIDSEMKLFDIAVQYGDRFLPGHIKALQAIQHCRTLAAGMTLLECNGCRTRDQKPMSCGHRHCNRCQNTDTSEWLQRQRQKLLPVEYFMVTFTLPAQLRALAWQHQRQVYDLLFRTAVDTLKQFGANSKKLDADLGMTGVLHTLPTAGLPPSYTLCRARWRHQYPTKPDETRRNPTKPDETRRNPTKPDETKPDETRRKEWRKLTGNYLFNGKSLATVFRAKLLRALDEQGLLSPNLKTRLPKERVVNCKRVGKGLSALEYLSRYLYRGVISDNNILANKRGKVTFSYLNSETSKKRSELCQEKSSCGWY